jgi:hypothetical protein
MNIKINLLQALKINKSNKDFILFDYDKNNKLTNFVLTNDLQRFKKQFKTFRVISCIKSNINTITI